MEINRSCPWAHRKLVLNGTLQFEQMAHSAPPSAFLQTAYRHCGMAVKDFLFSIHFLLKDVQEGLVGGEGRSSPTQGSGGGGLDPQPVHRLLLEGIEGWF